MVNWMALLQVAIVTILAAVIISTLMSLSNWFMTPVGTAETTTTLRKGIGFVLIAIMVIVVLIGLYLMIPYFR